MISTACPVVVNYIGKYNPNYAGCVVPYVLPVLAHCEMLRETYGRLSKEAMIQKAREVIKKNLATIQQIAYLLGEHAAESEVILNSIIRSVTTPEVE